MKYIFKKPLYWRELLLFTVVMAMACLLILGWFSWRTYNIQSERVKNTFKNEAFRINSMFVDTIDRTESIMQMIATQIRPNYEDIDYIHGALSQYKANPNVSNILSWTVFSWADANHIKRVDSTYGIIPKPIDMSVRTYIAATMEEPRQIHLGKTAKGFTSHRWVIPAGLGVVDNIGKYIGAVTIGFDIEYLTLRLMDTAKIEGVDFAVLDSDLQVVLSSANNWPKEKEITTLVPKDELLSLFSDKPLPERKPSVISNVSMVTENNYYFYKLDKYPYIVYLKYDKGLLQHEVWQSLTSRFIEVILIAIASSILIFLIYKREVSLRKEAEDAHETVRQMNGHLEEKVRERTFELERALKVKTDFLNNLSHEIRIPFQGVSAFSTALVERWLTLSEDERFSLAQKTNSSTERLFSFLNNILDIAKIEAGKMTFNMLPHNLTPLIAQVIQECEPLTLGKDVAITYETKSENPVIECDDTRIVQIIRNLLSNAIKFTAHGNITISVVPSMVFYEDKRKVNGVKVTIKDEGIGIPIDELKEIFNPFSQSSRTKSTAGGTGLGLGIVREIVHAHYGRIWAENNPDKGASFTFILPLTQPTLKKAPSTITTQEITVLKALEEEKQGNTKACNILMIDDEQICLEMISFLMHGTGYNVITAEGGVNGLQYLQENHHIISAVLLDMMMPDMHGLDVLAAIKNNPNLKHLPVIIQTGIANEEELTKSLTIGAACYVKKPYKRPDLVAALEKAIQEKDTTST